MWWGISSFVVLAAQLWSTSAHGTQGPWRVSFFEGMGRNEVSNAADSRSSFNSNCMISITNNSSSSQEGIITFEEVALEGPATNDNLPTPTNSHNRIPGIPCSNTVCQGSSITSGYTVTSPQTFSFSLAAGTSTTYIYVYDSFPANVTGAQNLRCSGSIRVRDSSTGSQGFILASGSLTTFFQTSRGRWLTGGTPTTADQMASLSQVQAPITINQGRPF